LTVESPSGIGEDQLQVNRPFPAGWQDLTQATDHLSVRPRRKRPAAAPDSLSPAPDTPVRLSFVDDHPALLRGLMSLFGADPRYRLAGNGSSAADLTAIAKQGNSDIIIVDLGLPGDVFGALQDVATSAQPTKMLVYTAHENVDLAVRALDSGVHAFVLKGRPVEELHEAISVVSRGEIYVSPGFSYRVFAGLNKTRGAHNTRLSGRERQLVKCLLEGKSNKEIAAALRLTEKTVKHYMTNLMGKLHVHSRLEVVVAAQRWSDGVSLAHDVNNDAALPLFRGSL
jgi:DNA-binding NarL/FixJ family response regulator